MSKKHKQYFPVEEIRFLLENQEQKTCFGCHKEIPKGDPVFSIMDDQHDLCWKCACLIKTKKEQTIRENEFDENMANDHRKRWKEISSGKNSNEILSLIFPDVLKIRFVSDQLK